MHELEWIILPGEAIETLRGQEFKKLLSFLSELWLIPLLGEDSARALQLSTVNRPGNIDISIQAVWVWKGGPSPGGLALGQQGDGWVTGLRALREGGSQPTPEHTAGQTAEGTGTGQPSPALLQSQEKCFEYGLPCTYEISKSQPDSGWRTLRQAFNHTLSDASPHIVTAAISWGPMSPGGTLGWRFTHTIPFNFLITGKVSSSCLSWVTLLTSS